ncbi:37118_t:CDS:1, partial [Racocetra persica]
QKKASNIVQSRECEDEDSDASSNYSENEEDSDDDGYNEYSGHGEGYYYSNGGKLTNDESYYLSSNRLGELSGESHTCIDWVIGLFFFESREDG